MKKLTSAIRMGRRIGVTALVASPRPRGVIDSRHHRL